MFLPSMRICSSSSSTRTVSPPARCHGSADRSHVGDVIWVILFARRVPGFLAVPPHPETRGKIRVMKSAAHWQRHQSG